ncbi:uroporphyrinogen-III synthase [Abyssalbus ytuae]|uniref:Uroporphyrinogen-III synthase n=1 Tax=Abyssalbus ytuae TaxID=2926907 RepID=A0A9E6ZVE6_9FLAO|nr:uroporphyrinogen-III synthase [Abyssalbus ytuae]UOB15937.1 uroporphyrinogen-III synthase [Abyssalbus ytuae]
MSIARIISTKKLTQAQKELLLNADISFIEANFIETVPLNFETDSHIENVIFTSQNAVKSTVKKKIKIDNCFCVGDKTEALLNDAGFKVVEKAYQAKALAKKIIENHPEKSFTFFCGDKRREELPGILKKYGVNLREVQVYKTELTSRTIQGDFDAVMFFSPSAVESFTKQNLFEDLLVFCIGKTTEAEAKKYTNNIITANKTTIENVIVQVVKHYKQND